jgi:hypothetical protein
VSSRAAWRPKIIVPRGANRRRAHPRDPAVTSSRHPPARLGRATGAEMFRCLHWSTLVWLLCRRLRRKSELCDDAVPDWGSAEQITRKSCSLPKRTGLIDGMKGRCLHRDGAPIDLERRSLPC